MTVRALFHRYTSTTEAIRQITERANALANGRSNAVGSFTCTVSAATTVVTDPNVSEDSKIAVTATTANAATELATLYIGTVANGSFTVTHANSAVADRTFDYSIQG